MNAYHTTILANRCSKVRAEVSARIANNCEVKRACVEVKIAVRRGWLT
jgi:hypothetical protein